MDVVPSLLLLAGVAVLAGMIYSGTKRRSQWGINFSRPSCPTCRQAFPRVRVPRSIRQALWGGHTCEKCGTEADKWGNKV